MVRERVLPLYKGKGIERGKHQNLSEHRVIVDIYRMAYSYYCRTNDLNLFYGLKQERVETCSKDCIMTGSETGLVKHCAKLFSIPTFKKSRLG